MTLFFPSLSFLGVTHENDPINSLPPPPISFHAFLRPTGYHIDTRLGTHSTPRQPGLGNFTGHRIHPYPCHRPVGMHEHRLWDPRI